jgi:3-phosphoshikimate 1-carboxyvinyltransferase
MRFLPPVAALATGRVVLDGDARARERPMAAIVDALHQLGVVVDAAPGGLLPIAITGTGSVAGGVVRIDASASSQFVSGLLLAGPRFDDGVTVVHAGGPLPSVPHIDMTVAMLAEHGVSVERTDATTWRVANAAIAALDRSIEPDLSNAAPFLAAAVVAGGSVTIPGWPRDSTQPGVAVADLLAAMGGTVTRGDSSLTVVGDGTIRSIDVDLGAIGELAPTIAALAALADGPSRLRGIAHLRGHETDRLRALAAELGGLGTRVDEMDDGLAITPGPLRAGIFHTYGDHRMATAGAIIGLRVPGVVLDDVGVTAKTLPGFTATWDRMLGTATGAS